MYTVDERDEVIELTDIPQSETGAPLPWVFADEDAGAVAFYVQNSPPVWDGTSVELITQHPAEPWVIVVFDPCYALMLGPPNDEAFSGHPLAHRGLQPYGAYFVRRSSWLRQLERMNALHSQHSPERFLRGKHHFILSFHDSTFECIARGYRVVRGADPLAHAVAEMESLLHKSGAEQSAEYSPPADRRASQRGLDLRKPVAAAGTIPRPTQSKRGWVTPGPAESQQGGLRVSVRERKGIVVLDLTAGPDVLSWGNFESQLNELLRASRKSIIVNLGNVTRIYALGVAALAQAFERARAEGAVIKLSNPSKGVQQALELTGVTASVEIYEDEDKAVASFENNRGTPR